MDKIKKKFIQAGIPIVLGYSKLEDLYGEENKDWKFVSQALVYRDDKKYDRYTIYIFKDKKEREVEVELYDYEKEYKKLPLLKKIKSWFSGY
jgi:hypothetical protein